MPLLIDEDVPDSVAQFLRERGHHVRYVREVAGRGTPDPVVAKIGDLAEAIIVTWNQKDFRRLATRIPEDNVQHFRHLGRISFTCAHSKGRARIEEVIDIIEMHFQIARSRRDRLLIEVQTTSIRVIM